jgi:hypothetical protein
MIDARKETGMAGRCSRIAVLVVALAQVAVGAGVARAANGPPIVGLTSNPAGVSAPGASVRYATRPVGGDTVVVRLGRGGRALASVRLRGSFVIPPVAIDGSPGGLSADGSTLVVTAPRIAFPQARTELAILDVRRLRVVAYRLLSGDFSFDAISPDGRRAYLIQYLSGVDATRYRVRAYDLRTAQFEPHAVVDPRERADAMTGYPVTRKTSVDGRWAYTLYVGTGRAAHPFVHALDTAASKAVCVDLPVLPPGGDPYDARLQLRGGELAVLSGGSTVALVDARTFAVSRPGKASLPVTRPTRDGGGVSVPLISALGLTALAVVAIGATLTRRRKDRTPARPPGHSRAARFWPR